MPQLVTNAGKLVRGYLQTATRFNGATTQGIHRSSSPTGSFTVATWLRVWRHISGSTNGLFGVSDSDDSSNTCAAIEHDGNTFQFQGAGTPGGTPVNLGSIKIGIWTFVAYTISAGVNVVAYWYYDDGTNAAALTSSSFTLSVSSAFAFTTIGHINGDVSKADFREQRNWSSVLSASDLLAEAKSPTPIITANLYSWYPLITTAGGAELLDASGNARTLTSNATTPTTVVTVPGSPAGPSYLNVDQNLIASP